MTLGPLNIEFGGVRHRVGPFWIRDGLHIWIGRRGVHLFWRSDPPLRHVEWDLLPDKEAE